MPGSLWDGKKWPIERFVEVARGAGLLSVVLGTDRDPESAELVRALENAGIRLLSGVGKWSLSETATVLAGAEAFVGNDTGLAHLAEAVGTRALVVFGPTVPEMGFGPWRPESRAIGASLGCRPCGKDGRYCYRLHDRYRCIQAVTSEQVLQELKPSL
jgi:heptosyltransferase-2